MQALPPSNIRERALKERRYNSKTEPGPEPSSAVPFSSARRMAVGVAGAAGALAVLAAVFVFNAMYDSDTTFVNMGFDPGRAQLISALIFGGIAGAASALVDARIGRASLYGAAVATLLFVETFANETSDALKASGALGTFDLGGWLITALTLAFFVLVCGWVGATLAGGIRPSLVNAVQTVVAVTRRRGVDRQAAYRTAAVALIAVLAVMTVPVFNDLVNLTPDARMLHGGPALQGLGVDSGPTLVPAATPTPGASSPSVSASPSTPPTAKPTISLAERPWLAWKPSGTGRVTKVAMTPPWKGAAKTAEVVIYTPPGYDPHGSVKYPVIYETPSPYSLWDGGTSVGFALDSLIDNGDMPASIVAFISSAGGYYVDSQCADSYDGREWFDTYVSKTIVAYVDSHYPTIATRKARAVAGMSQGGFCAANLMLRHPEVFGTSISFSGYFHAGFGGAASLMAFGSGKTIIEANSPDIQAGKLDAALRPDLFFILIAKPDQPWYGEQTTAFEKILATDGYPHLGIVATDPHGWVQVRNETPSAFMAWGTRLVATGVFG